MSTMLNFYELAWATARDRALAGRNREALVALEPILISNDSAAELKLLAHRLAARIEVHYERFRKARKHLYIAQAIEPANAEIDFEIGVAFERDPYGCDRRAARRFRRAVRLAPENDQYRAHLGRALVRINRVRAGLKRLLSIQNADDVGVVEVVVEGLTDAGRTNEAEKIIRKSRFLNAREAKLRQMHGDVRFAAAARQQAKNRVARALNALMVLPFLKIAGEGIVRHDSRSAPRPHFGRLKAFQG